MATVDVTRENLQQIIKPEGIAVLDWWAPWCGPCRDLAALYERVSERHPDITFGKINTQDERELATTFQVEVLPTLMVFRDGVLLVSQAGMLSEALLEEAIRQAQAIDMVEVRREIEQEKQRKKAPMPSA